MKPVSSDPIFSDDLLNVSKTAETASKLKTPDQEIVPGGAIDYCKFGDDYAVYNRISGTLLVLNSSAFAILKLLGQGATNSEIARMIAANSGAPYQTILDDIETQKNQWSNAGLFDEANNAPDHPPLPECHLKANFKSGENNFVFSSNDQTVFSLFCDLLAPLSGETPFSAGEGLVELSLSVEDGKYSVWFDGAHLYGPEEFPPARHTAIAKIATLAANQGVGSVFHASAFMFHEKTFLVSGRSGAGKSTLTATIAAQNAIYLADDLVAMNEQLDALYPNPVRLNVKASSFKVINKLYPELQTATDWNVAGVKTRYIQPAKLPEFDSCAVDYLIFPQFDKEATVGAYRLESRNALMKLALNGIDLSRNSGAIGHMVNFISRTPCYDLNYSSSEEAYEMINQFSLSK